MRSAVMLLVGLSGLAQVAYAEQASAGPDAAQLAAFDNFVRAVQAKFEVPGVAVAIVQVSQFGRTPKSITLNLSQGRRVAFH